MTPKRFRAIESQRNGPEYICFWLKLLIRAISQEEPGRLRFKETIPYNDDLLASVTKTDIDTVRSAMKLFQQLGMLTIVADGTIWIEEAQRMVGSESSSAERVRRFRERQKDGPQLLEAHPETEPAPTADEGDNGSKVQEYSAGFEAFWTVYPRKKEKVGAAKKYRACLKAGATDEQLLGAATSYAEECKRKGAEETYIKHAATFLGPAAPWRDYMGMKEQEKPEKTTTPDNSCPKCLEGTVIGGMCRAPGCGYRVPA